MTKYQNEIRLLILGSLYLLSIKTFFYLFQLLFFIEGEVSLAAFWLSLLLFVVAVGQIVGIRKEKKYTWLLSTIQIFLVFFTSEGTFSWIYQYLFSSLNTGHHLLYSYFISAIFIVSETLKTYWLYDRTRSSLSRLHTSSS